MKPFLIERTLAMLTGIALGCASLPAAGAEELVSVTEMRALVDARREDTVIVDTRCPDAYAGWPLGGLARGGHLPGAVNFAARWLAVERPDREAALREALRRMGITEQRRIVLYDVSGTERKAVAAFLAGIGIRQVAYFDLEPWADIPALPLVAYPNHSLLVPPVVVKALLDGDRPATFENAGRIRFAEVSWGDESKSYAKGHIPGSFHVDTEAFEPPPLWVLAPPDVLRRFAGEHGITSGDTVILSGAEPMACFRLAVVLRYMGVADVRVLSGGLAAWQAAGYPVETRSHRPEPSADFGAAIPARPGLIDTCEELKKEMRGNPGFTLVDIRTWEEHIGKISGYSYHQQKGRIPGAVFGHAGTRDPLSLDAYRNIDGTMRSAGEILQLWKDAGIDPGKHLSFMCGGGWRAAEVLTYAQVMGLEKVSLFSDGWIGWSRDPDNPTATGLPAPRR